MHSSAPPSSFALEPGFRLDRYELLCVLARGGMATVWLARFQGKHRFEKLVAVKTILGNHAADPAFRDMFLDEGRLASMIEHPNVVHVLDLGEQHDTLYLVMELVDGDPLQKLARACEKAGTTVPLGIAMRITSDICAGLDAAHRLCGPDGESMNVVHRDISPQNILVTTTGIAKVIDFGIAKARDRAAGETSTGTIKGKLHFMCREQALGRPIDQRADTWSAGAVLYFLLTGRPPYKEENQLATLQALMNADPIAPPPASLPPTIKKLITKALSHDPLQQFQTASEMQAAIDQAMQDCKLTTSAVHVAAFVADHLKPRAEARKLMIDTALKEAANRALAQKILTKAPSSEEFTTGNGPLGAGSDTVLNRPREMGSSPDFGGPPDTDPNGTHPGSGSGLSNGTLASAALYPGTGAPTSRPWSSRKVIAGVIGVACVAVAAVAFLGRGSGHATATTSAIQTPKPEVGALPPPRPLDAVPSGNTPVAPTTATSTPSAAPSAKHNVFVAGPAVATAIPAASASAAPKPPPKKKGDDELGF